MKGTNTVKVQDLLSLASQYRAAAFKLEGAPPDPTQLPQRLLALHAIELYLDALLRAKGIEEQPIGTFRHDLGERARIAVSIGLVLRNRTLAHLQTLSSATEYVVVRYDPKLTSTLSQLNRVMATLEEVARKVSKMMRQKRAVNGKQVRQANLEHLRDSRCYMTEEARVIKGQDSTKRP
ncbi:hypothetical protein [Shinella oryzae]|uniref:HEPN domain-containing protein n=1 Tax=Shinella oryzae TaxID=2871820 RepID=A0ABY9KA18_9HYPH|nr:hypothetical protein [Shinella oryzae]WLS05383.1 hypothetical protein Q9315_24905 [Shinella oryzae]